MSKGKLVPDEMILKLIRNALTVRGWLSSRDEPRPYNLNSVATTRDISNHALSHNLFNIPSDREGDYEYSDHPNASFILDGFPRTSGQAQQLASLIPINMVIHIHTPSEIILDRICNRWIHPGSGRVYNTTFNAPKAEGRDDTTGEPLVQRDDDKPDVWKARLKSFEENAAPLLDHYEKLGVLWKVEGNSSDEISPQIYKEFQSRFGG